MGLNVASASFVPETIPLNSCTYPVVPSRFTFAIGGSVTSLLKPLRKKLVTNGCCIGFGAPDPTSSTVAIVIVVLPDFEKSAAAVAVTVTFVLTVMFGGEVYNPVWSMLPVCGLMLHTTALLGALLTVAVNCWL